MTAWPRDIEPQQASSFVMPGALDSWSQSGKAQHRSTVQVGRIWSETYPPFQASSAFGRKLIAFINNVWRNGTQFDIDHYSYLTHNGGGSGTPLVNGASQTGATLITDTWGGSSPVVKAGDIIRIAGISHVFDVTADSTNLGGGGASIPINPPIFAGGAPADNAAVTYTGVRLNAFIYGAPSIPNAGPDGFIAGLSITFREAP